jgi:hypothetical protein
MQASDPRASSPLAPAFERGSASFQAQIKRAMSDSKSLGNGYYAAKMEVGVANAQAQPTFYGYGTHKPMTMSLKKALPDDRLDLVMCMNVSGQDFKDANKVPLPDALEKKTARAKDNTYVIQVTHADGRKELMKGIGAKGEFSSAQDISIKGMKPGKTIVEMWPEGSAGVGGYVEGRRLEINYSPPGHVTDSFG